MSADYIGLGFTADIIKINSLTADIRGTVQGSKIDALERLASIVEPFMPLILNRIEAGALDYQGTYSDVFYPTLAEQHEAVQDALVSALFWVQEDHDYNGYAVPGTNFTFITAGGVTWGDSPFDEFEAVCLLSDTAYELPAFGRAVGVLGGGILLDFLPE